MCVGCRFSNDHHKMFSDIHSNKENEFLNQGIKICDDENTKLKREELNKCESFDTYISLGAALSFQLRYREALPYLKKALEINPNSYEAHRKIALIYMKIMDFKKSYDEFLYCLDFTDDLLDIKYRLGLTSFYMGNYEEALVWLSECFMLSINRGEMYIATLYWYELALEKLNKPLDSFYKYLNDFNGDAGHHIGYELYIRFINNECSLEKLDLVGINIDTLSKSCLYYGLAVHFEENEYLHKKYLELMIEQEEFFAGFAYIAGFVEYKKKF